MSLARLLGKTGNLQKGVALWKRYLSFLGSMRFAVSALVILSLASVIGTVIPQAADSLRYLDLFGEFWGDLFAALGLFRVYNAPWFLLILGFVLFSTTYCVVRNTPIFLRAMSSFQHRLTGAALQRLPYHRQWSFQGKDKAQIEAAVQAFLRCAGFRYRCREAQDGALLWSAKRFHRRRWGYILTHTAIIVIGLGGILDSQLWLHWEIWRSGKSILSREATGDFFSEQNQIQRTALSFRGQTTVAEGDRVQHTVVAISKGDIVQRLPFALTLNKFWIEHYPTGQPRRFASDVRVHLPDEVVDTTIEVNHPFRYGAYRIYQSGFTDGGSHLQMALWPLNQAHVGPNYMGTVGQKLDVSGYHQWQIKLTQLRPINVEQLSEINLPALQQRGTGSAVLQRVFQERALQNVGPSFGYEVRAPSGELWQLHNYLAPVTLEDTLVFLVGVREQENQPYRYWRIPADHQRKMDAFWALRATILQPNWHAKLKAQALLGLKQQAVQASAEKLEVLLSHVLDLFSQGGLVRVGQFIEAQIPDEQQEMVSEIYLQILHALVRAGCELQPVCTKQQQLAPESLFLQHSLQAISDGFSYPIDFILSLKHFELRQASVFQITRSFGQYFMLLGAILLSVGIWMMLYLRHEERLWLWQQQGVLHCGWKMITTKRQKGKDAEQQAQQKFKQIVQQLEAKF